MDRGNTCKAMKPPSQSKCTVSMSRFFYRIFIVIYYCNTTIIIRLCSPRNWFFRGWNQMWQRILVVERCLWGQPDHTALLAWNGHSCWRDTRISSQAVSLGGKSSLMWQQVCPWDALFRFPPLPQDILYNKCMAGVGGRGRGGWPLWRESRVSFYPRKISFCGAYEKIQNHSIIKNIGLFKKQNTLWNIV